MRFVNGPPKLDDCRDHGADADNELIIVEGDSAARSVASVRNPQSQAVLPMQGKPMNAHKAGAARLSANPWFKALIEALGCGIGERFRLEAMRYRRVLLLFDPDADGIHSGALMLIFFHRFMPGALTDGRILMVRAPLLRLTSPMLEQPVYLSSPAQHPAQVDALAARGVHEVQTLRYRGLGSLEPALLTSWCVDPQTRHTEVMKLADAELAQRYFGGTLPGKS